ncbi:uncharacterized protein LOC141853526 [Brevipalpus obovatus]|uniref:uncharacterized protein LOC141853524 n=1 Tax=Brevipalpus obovatus TaxID=246614 RepID=UPI003D9EE65A
MKFFNRPANMEEVLKGEEPKPTKYDELLSRIYGTKSRDVPTHPSSQSGGVMPMTLRTRFYQERHRLGGDFNEKWRKWRVQFIKDQALHPLEPAYNADFDKFRLNVFRRTWRWPGNQFEMFLCKHLHPTRANAIRRSITISLRIYLFALSVFYYMKYNGRTWEVGTNLRYRGLGTAEKVFPGDPAYPYIGSRVTKDDYFDLGFKSRNVLLYKPEDNVKS